jgi:hypothetical protein
MTDQRYTDLGDEAAASTTSREIVRRWMEGQTKTSDLADMEEEHYAERVHHCEQITRDQEVVQALLATRFRGLAREEFAEALIAYAESYLYAWIRSGRIFARCREKGIHIQRVPGVSPCDKDIEILAIETLSRALLRFEALLQEGGWSPERGATLTTFFAGQVLLSFPNVYRAWVKNYLRNSWVPLEVLDEDDLRNAPGVRHLDPAETVVSLEEFKQLSEQFQYEALHALAFQAMGYTMAEVAELLGKSEKAIEMILYRHRRRVGGGGERS